MITKFTLKTSFLPKDTDNAIVWMFRDFLTHIYFALQKNLRNTVQAKAETFKNYYGKTIEYVTFIWLKSHTLFRFCQHPQQGVVFKNLKEPADLGKVKIPNKTFNHNKFSIFKPSICLASALLFMPTTPFSQIFLSIRINYRNIVFKEMFKDQGIISHMYTPNSNYQQCLDEPNPITFAFYTLKPGNCSISIQDWP